MPRPTAKKKVPTSKTKHQYDPITRERRRRKFLTKEGYIKSIEDKQAKHHLNSLMLLRRAQRGLSIVKITSKGMSQTEIAFKQALFINNKARDLVDAEIDVTYKTDQEPSGIKLFEEKPDREKDRIKKQMFDKWVDHLIGLKAIKKHPRAIVALDEIINYLRLPVGIYNARDKHKKLFRKIRAKIVKRKIDPMQNFLERIDEIMVKQKVGENYSAKAMDVCVAASLYADMTCKEKQRANPKIRWSDVYQKAMETAYPKIRTNEKLLNAITALR
ncbi:MAG: hypothetical protein HON47_04850 [Candidatus Diapherotrites archaeon]|jgi:hypothetical protein|uniref:Uncharacterized protein n=1 Tax=Candidatus Iainarchaeum sp. TaxID=3101447 RepID=A0A8T5GGM7_9ARCH|nr:hypothetical protein [Candidatus Diapherotrites archaeon]MBT7241274.1 hypothetical protein [Candidatus Diapherotrites archaeon]